MGCQANSDSVMIAARLLAVLVVEHDARLGYSEESMSRAPEKTDSIE